MRTIPSSILVLVLLFPACTPDSRQYDTGTGGSGGAGSGGVGGVGGSGGSGVGGQGGGGSECTPGTADCDFNPDCETDVAADRNNCGGCGVVCQGACVGGTCDDPVHIVAAYDHTCAITRLGTFYCWGRNASRELGIGGIDDVATPTLVSVAGRVVHADGGGVQLASGASVAHTCAVLEDTTVQCWGGNSDGQLGIGSGSWQDKPATVVSLVGAIEVSAGGRHTCAVTNKGELYCWGANDKGQLGIDSPDKERNVPALVGLSDVKQVSTGDEHTCAIKMDGTLYCWGANGWGRLGIGSGLDQPLPKVVSLTGVERISAGGEHTCALKAGSLYCWGNGYQGQLGIKDEYTWRETPTEPSVVTSPIFVAAGLQHTAAIGGGNGQVFVTGVNVPLGNGTTDTAYVPVAIELYDTVEIAAGRRHTCTVSTTDQVHCWGDDSHGQIGSGVITSADVLLPSLVVFP